MKKKIFAIIIMFTMILTLTGCFDKDELENSNITTTVYPIEYLVTRLYKGETKVKSIYPNDVKISDYKLTDKQLTDYSKSTTIFVYNGLTEEKEIAKSLINKNKKIQIIDVAYGLKYSYGIEELWLNPNNYLMLANTIKKDLQEFSSSKYAAKEIEEHYGDIEEDLTTLDVELRQVGKNARAKGTQTIVIAYNSLGFLEKYGFDVVNISNESAITSQIKNKFKNKEYKYILVDSKENVTDSVKDLVDNYEAELVEINMMTTLSDKQKENNDNYLTIMHNFLNTLSNITTK